MRYTIHIALETKVEEFANEKNGIHGERATENRLLLTENI